jgi:hypothetical protein
VTNPIIPLDIPNARVPLTERRGIMPQHIVRFLTDLVRRLGGERRDYVREARTRAYESEAMVLALLRGISTGYYHTPSNPLSYTASSTTTATINVAQHTRSTAAATIQAGSVANVARGQVHYVYYDDVGNAGGAVTFASATSVANLTAAGRKLVGAIYVEEPTPTGGAPT